MAHTPNPGTWKEICLSLRSVKIGPASHIWELIHPPVVTMGKRAGPHPMLTFNFSSNVGTREPALPLEAWWMQESCLCPFPAAALGRAGFTLTWATQQRWPQWHGHRWASPGGHESRRTIWQSWPWWCVYGRVSPTPCQLPHSCELALPLTRAVLQSWPWRPEHRRASPIPCQMPQEGELDPPLAWTKQESWLCGAGAGEWAVWITQLQPRPTWSIRASTPSMNRWRSWRGRTASPKLQDVHDTGQQDIQEESSWGSTTYGVAEARGSRTRPLIYCKEHLQVKLFVQKSILCDTPCHMTASMGEGDCLEGCKGQSTDMEEHRDGWDLGWWCEINKESIKGVLTSGTTNQDPW